jgi:hypothetical protein
MDVANITGRWAMCFLSLKGPVSIFVAHIRPLVAAGFHADPSARMSSSLRENCGYHASLQVKRNLGPLTNAMAAAKESNQSLSLGAT